MPLDGDLRLQRVLLQIGLVEGPALGRHPARIEHNLIIGGVLRGIAVPVLVDEGGHPGVAVGLDFHHVLPIKGEAVEEHQIVTGALGAGGQPLGLLLDQLNGPMLQPLILHLGGVVDFLDGGAGQDVVELIQQDIFPCVVDLFGVVGIPQQRGEHAEELHILPQEFTPPVGALVPGHGGPSLLNTDRRSV